MTGELGGLLVGRALPAVRLPSTEGGEVDLGALKGAWVVLYTYPKNMVDMSGVRIPDVWDQIPGLRGCTAEACGFRDASADLMGRSTKVYRVSTQSTAYQQEFVRRFHLPFALLSDASLRLAGALSLPTVVIEGEILLRRLTLIADPQCVVRKVYGEGPDPGSHALEVLAYLKGGAGRPRSRGRHANTSRSVRCCRAATGRSLPTSRTWAA